MRKKNSGQGPALEPAETIGLPEILNSLPIGVLLINLDGLVLHGNSQAASLIGTSRQSLMGLSLGALWPASAEEIMAAVRSGRQAAGLTISELNDCFAQTNPLPEKAKGAVISLFDNRLWRPYLNPGQTIDPLTPYFRKIFQASSDGISIADRHGRLILVNDASAGQVGVKPKDLQGRNVSVLTDQGLTNGTVTMEVLKDKRPVSRMIKHLKTNKDILLTGTPIFNPEGDVHLVVINERDLTALFGLKDNLRQHQQMLDRFKDELTALQLTELTTNEVVAVSPAMRLTMETAIKLAHHEVSQILITGESGTGKGLLAKFIHYHSPKADEPFIHINCAALPEALLEAELFGYEKGAFTGASPKGRAGLFELAGSGTVFLDEIGEMPLFLQTKLLTFLDNHEFRRISGRQAIKAACSIIAATNQDLEQLAARKEFRADLYYRLNGFKLSIPPLRQRPEDLLALAFRELKKLNQLYSQKKELDAQAVEFLCGYPFPGNVRELLNSLQQAVLLGEGTQLGPFLKQILAKAKPAAAVAAQGPGHQDNGAPGQTATPGDTLGRSVAEIERSELINALRICRSTRQMAEKLGVSQATVSRKLKKHNLSPPAGKDPNES